MRSFLNWLITVILAIIVGFWLSYNHVLEDTWVGEQLVTISEFLPPHDEELEEPVIVEENTTPAEKSEQEVTSQQDISYLDQITEGISAEEADPVVIEEVIFVQLNQLREELGLHPVQHHDTLQGAARMRAQESATSFSHTRPDGRETFTVLNPDEFYYPYRLAGENLGMATFFFDEAYMANALFSGWVDSQGHYETMVNEQFQEVGIGVYIEDNMVYSAQIFGTQQ